MTGQNSVFKTIKRKTYSAKEFFEFSKDKKDKKERYELIGGKIYLMASPSTEHQNILGEIYGELRNYLKGKQCRPFMAPLDVILFEKNKKNECRNVFQPDVFAVCDLKKIDKNKINGAPDFVVEIVSPSNPENDYYYKLDAYMKYGVKEYWIVNPETKQISVYIRQKSKEVKLYTRTFEDRIESSVFEDFAIDFKELNL